MDNYDDGKAIRHIQKMCKNLCLDYEKVISDKLQIIFGFCYVDGYKYDDRVELIMSIRLLLVNLISNVEFRHQVWEYYKLI